MRIPNAIVGIATLVVTSTVWAESLLPSELRIKREKSYNAEASASPCTLRVDGEHIEGEVSYVFCSISNASCASCDIDGATLEHTSAPEHTFVNVVPKDGSMVYFCGLCIEGNLVSDWSEPVGKAVNPPSMTTIRVQ